MKNDTISAEPIRTILNIYSYLIQQSKTMIGDGGNAYYNWNDDSNWPVVVNNVISNDFVDVIQTWGGNEEGAVTVGATEKKSAGEVDEDESMKMSSSSSHVLSQSEPLNQSSPSPTTTTTQPKQVFINALEYIYNNYNEEILEKLMGSGGF